MAFFGILLSPFCFFRYILYYNTHCVNAHKLRDGYPLVSSLIR
nr:MAG TPA: hypothetical protein [Caudoviricetes sp.]